MFHLWRYITTCILILLLCYEECFVFLCYEECYGYLVTTFFGGDMLVDSLLLLGWSLLGFWWMKYLLIKWSLLFSWLCLWMNLSVMLFLLCWLRVLFDYSWTNPSCKSYWKVYSGEPSLVLSIKILRGSPRVSSGQTLGITLKKSTHFSPKGFLIDLIYPKKE